MPCKPPRRSLWSLELRAGLPIRTSKARRSLVTVDPRSRGDEKDELQATSEAEMELRPSRLRVRVKGVGNPERLWRLVVSALVIVGGGVGAVVVMLLGNLWQALLVAALGSGVTYLVWRMGGTS